MTEHGFVSGNGPESPRPDTDTMSGAYVLDALDHDERTAFEARMTGSADLRAEVDGLSATAVLLARAATPVEPSAELRSSILGLLSSTPQLPPLAAPAKHAARVEPEVDEHIAPVIDVASGAGDVRRGSRLAHSRWYMRPSILLAGAAAAVGLFFGGGAILNGTHPVDGTTQVAASGVTQILTASDVKHTVSDVSTGGTATLYWSNGLKRSAVILNGVETLPAGKTYELWYINGSGKASAAGTVDMTSHSVTHVLQGELKKGDTIGLTVEPAGGSTQPTSQPIAAIQSA